MIANALEHNLFRWVHDRLCITFFWLPRDLHHLFSWLLTVIWPSVSHFDTWPSWAHRTCDVLVAVAWVGSCVLSSAQILLAFSLPFCGPSVIGHYLRNLQSLLKLACTHTYVTSLPLVSNSGAICTVSFVTLMFSYAIILHSLKPQCWGGKPIHLLYNIIVVILFFGPCICIYPRPATIFPWIRW